MIETLDRGRRSTMGRKRHGAEQMIAKLREAEVELARGKTAGEVCRKLGVTEQTYYPAAGVRGAPGRSGPPAQGARAGEYPAEGAGRGPGAGCRDPAGG